MRLYIAKLVCRLKGHLKPKRLRLADIMTEYYYCVRCGKKIKIEVAQNLVPYKLYETLKEYKK